MDRQTDGRTDGEVNNIPIAFLKKHGDNNCYYKQEIILHRHINSFLI